MGSQRCFVAIAITAALLLGAPPAQAADKVPRIGVLWHAGSEEEEETYLTALRQGFRDLGYVEGKNITLLNTYAGEQYERFDNNAVTLVGSKVDVLIAVTRPAAAAAQRATTTVPIVFVVVPDPVGMKLVASLARPGGNITGLTNMGTELAAKRLEIFKQAIAGLSRVALLLNPTDPAVTRSTLDESRAAARRLNIIVQPIEVRAPEDFEPAFAAIGQARLNGVVAGADSMMFNERTRIAKLAMARRLPTMLFVRGMVEAGGLMSYGPSSHAIFRRAAAYVDKILKGAKPGDLPVEQPTRFELVFNLKTAKALGLTIPQSVLFLADQVIQ